MQKSPIQKDRGFCSVSGKRIMKEGAVCSLFLSDFCSQAHRALGIISFGLICHDLQYNGFSCFRNGIQCDGPHIFTGFDDACLPKDVALLVKDTNLQPDGIAFRICEPHISGVSFGNKLTADAHQISPGIQLLPAKSFRNGRGADNSTHIKGRWRKFRLFLPMSYGKRKEHYRNRQDTQCRRRDQSFLPLFQLFYRIKLQAGQCLQIIVRLEQSGIFPIQEFLIIIEISTA